MDCKRSHKVRVSRYGTDLVTAEPGWIRPVGEGNKEHAGGADAHGSDWYGRISYWPFSSHGADADRFATRRFNTASRAAWSTKRSCAAFARSRVDFFGRG